MRYAHSLYMHTRNIALHYCNDNYDYNVYTLALFSFLTLFVILV